MTRPRLLDLFCGAGGAAMGYHRAGFDVVGVDIVKQPRYPFEFHHGDALEFLAVHGSEFDAIHASPPCQAHSALRHLHPERDYECFIERTRILLRHSGRPWLIENVPGAPLINTVQLCGSAFGLKVRRHRIFESSFSAWGTGCKHAEQGSPIDVSGTGGRRVNRRPDDHGGACNKPHNLAHARAVIDICWMTRKELAQAIPPAYTEYLGKQLMSAIIARKESA